MKNDDPIWLAYLWESWGPTPEQQRELKALDERIRSEGGAGASSKFREERARGKKAYKAKLELGKVFDTSGELATKLWIFEARKSWLNDHKIVATLERELKKRIEREQNLRNRHSHRVQRTKIHTGLIDGLHPNCLRALKPSDSWTIYIDETGAEFDSTAEDPRTQTKWGVWWHWPFPMALSFPIAADSMQLIAPFLRSTRYFNVCSMRRLEFSASVFWTLQRDTGTGLAISSI